MLNVCRQSCLGLVLHLRSLLHLHQLLHALRQGHRVKHQRRLLLEHWMLGNFQSRLLNAASQLFRHRLTVQYLAHLLQELVATGDVTPVNVPQGPPDDVRAGLQHPLGFHALHVGRGCRQRPRLARVTQFLSL